MYRKSIDYYMDTWSNIVHITKTQFTGCVFALETSFIFRVPFLRMICRCRGNRFCLSVRSLFKKNRCKTLARTPNQFHLWIYKERKISDNEVLMFAKFVWAIDIYFLWDFIRDNKNKTSISFFQMLFIVLKNVIYANTY